MCDLYPTSVLENNVINFTSLIEKLNEKHTLIYASSGSVYGDCKTDPVTEDYVLNKPHNMYDLSKQLIDTYTLMGNHKCSIIGLRFGTVNGFSPVFRDDIMLNAMTSTALKTNEILLFNPNTKRSILGINDLCRAIVSVINNNKKLCDVYNLCSFTKTSKEMALIVSDIVKCPIKEIATSLCNIAPTKLNEKLVSNKYNFALSCDKFISNFNFVFNETPDMIIENILKNKNNMIYTNRNTSFLYKKEY
jgi:nucleoside-diphosphate-sugar epimerase